MDNNMITVVCVIKDIPDEKDSSITVEVLDACAGLDGPSHCDVRDADSHDDDSENEEVSQDESSYDSGIDFDGSTIYAQPTGEKGTSLKGEIEEYCIKSQQKVNGEHMEEGMELNGLPCQYNDSKLTSFNSMNSVAGEDDTSFKSTVVSKAAPQRPDELISIGSTFVSRSQVEIILECVKLLQDMTTMVESNELSENHKATGNGDSRDLMRMDLKCNETVSPLNCGNNKIPENLHKQSTEAVTHLCSVHVNGHTQNGTTNPGESEVQSTTVQDESSTNINPRSEKNSTDFTVPVMCSPCLPFDDVSNGEVDNLSLQSLSTDTNVAEEITLEVKLPSEDSQVDNTLTSSDSSCRNVMDATVTSITAMENTNSNENELPETPGKDSFNNVLDCSDSTPCRNDNNSELSADTHSKHKSYSIAEHQDEISMSKDRCDPSSNSPASENITTDESMSTNRDVPHISSTSLFEPITPPPPYEPISPPSLESTCNEVVKLSSAPLVDIGNTKLPAICSTLVIGRSYEMISPEPDKSRKKSEMEFLKELYAENLEHDRQESIARMNSANVEHIPERCDNFDKQNDHPATNELVPVALVSSPNDLNARDIAPRVDRELSQERSIGPFECQNPSVTPNGNIRQEFPNCQHDDDRPFHQTFPNNTENSGMFRKYQEIDNHTAICCTQRSNIHNHHHSSWHMPINELDNCNSTFFPPNTEAPMIAGNNAPHFRKYTNSASHGNCADADSYYKDGSGSLRDISNEEFRLNFPRRWNNAFTSAGTRKPYIRSGTMLDDACRNAAPTTEEGTVRFSHLSVGPQMVDASQNQQFNHKRLPFGKANVAVGKCRSYMAVNFQPRNPQQRTHRYQNQQYNQNSRYSARNATTSQRPVLNHGHSAAVRSTARQNQAGNHSMYKSVPHEDRVLRPVFCSQKSALPSIEQVFPRTLETMQNRFTIPPKHIQHTYGLIPEQSLLQRTLAQQYNSNASISVTSSSSLPHGTAKQVTASQSSACLNSAQRLGTINDAKQQGNTNCLQFRIAPATTSPICWASRAIKTAYPLYSSRTQQGLSRFSSTSAVYRQVDKSLPYRSIMLKDACTTSYIPLSRPPVITVPLQPTTTVTTTRVVPSTHADSAVNHDMLNIPNPTQSAAIPQGEGSLASYTLTSNPSEKWTINSLPGDLSMASEGLGMPKKKNTNPHLTLLNGPVFTPNSRGVSPQSDLGLHSITTSDNQSQNIDRPLAMTSTRIVTLESPLSEDYQGPLSNICEAPEDEVCQNAKESDTSELTTPFVQLKPTRNHTPVASECVSPSVNPVLDEVPLKPFVSNHVLRLSSEYAKTETYDLNACERAELVSTETNVSEATAFQTDCHIESHAALSETIDAANWENRAAEDDIELLRTESFLPTDTSDISNCCSDLDSTANLSSSQRNIMLNNDEGSMGSPILHEKVRQPESQQSSEEDVLGYDYESMIKAMEQDEDEKSEVSDSQCKATAVVDLDLKYSSVIRDEEMPLADSMKDVLSKFSQEEGAEYGYDLTSMLDAANQSQLECSDIGEPNKDVQSCNATPNPEECAEQTPNSCLYENDSVYSLEKRAYKRIMRPSSSDCHSDNTEFAYGGDSQYRKRKSSKKRRKWRRIVEPPSSSDSESEETNIIMKVHSPKTALNISHSPSSSDSASEESSIIVKVHSPDTALRLHKLNISHSPGTSQTCQKDVSCVQREWSTVDDMDNPEPKRKKLTIIPSADKREYVRDCQVILPRVKHVRFRLPGESTRKTVNRKCSTDNSVDGGSDGVPEINPAVDLASESEADEENHSEFEFPQKNNESYPKKISDNDFVTSTDEFDEGDDSSVHSEVDDLPTETDIDEEILPYEKHTVCHTGFTNTDDSAMAEQETGSQEHASAESDVEETYSARKSDEENIFEKFYREGEVSVNDSRLENEESFVSNFNSYDSDDQQVYEKSIGYCSHFDKWPFSDDISSENSSSDDEKEIKGLKSSKNSKPSIYSTENDCRNNHDTIHQQLNAYVREHPSRTDAPEIQLTKSLKMRNVWFQKFRERRKRKIYFRQLGLKTNSIRENYFEFVTLMSKAGLVHTDENVRDPVEVPPVEGSTLDRR